MKPAPAYAVTLGDTGTVIVVCPSCRIAYGGAAAPMTDSQLAAEQAAGRACCTDCGKRWAGRTVRSVGAASVTRARAVAIAAFALSCVAATCLADAPARSFTARVTYYEPRNCPYGNVTATGRYAVEGVTVAVDPKVVPYGSRVRIPALDGLVGDGWFLAQDTGSAVKSRKAARRWGSRAPVVDVFVASPRRLAAVERAAPMFCAVEVWR